MFPTWSGQPRLGYFDQHAILSIVCLKVHERLWHKIGEREYVCKELSVMDEHYDTKPILHYRYGTYTESWRTAAARPEEPFSLLGGAKSYVIPQVVTE
jgi:hypothetical protein